MDFPEQEKKTKKERHDIKWAGTIEFFVSLIGSTAGLSDFWRFPYLAWKNGGGAFLIAFIIMLTICGIPIYYLEITMSQYSSKGVYSVWGLYPIMKGIGISVGVMNLAFICYNSTFRLWLVEYIVNCFKSDIPWTSCDNDWNTDACVVSDSLLLNNGQVNITNNVTSNYSGALMSAEEEFWQNKVLYLSSGLTDFGEFRWWFVLYSVIYRVIVALCLVKSIKTIGKVMYVTSIIPNVLILAIFIRALTLPGAVDGILFFITPNFSQLKSIQVWIEAMFMAFYTLGPVWGGIIMIGSHSKFHTNTTKTTVVCCTGDVVIAVFSSLVLFSVLGVMAHDIGVDVKDVVRADMSIGMVGYSRALAYLPGPRIWSAVFFISIGIASMDGQIVTVEVIVSVIEEWQKKFTNKRHILLVTATSFIIFVLNLPFCTQAGAYLFQLIDWYQPTWPCMVVALLEIITICWLYGGDRVERGVRDMTGRSMPHIIRVGASYISPVVFVILLVISFTSYKPPTYGEYEYSHGAQVFGWTLAGLMILPIPLWILIPDACQNKLNKKAISTLTVPEKEWGPIDETYRIKYQQFINRKLTLAGLLYFNLTGRYRKCDKHVIANYEEDISLGSTLKVNVDL